MNLFKKEKKTFTENELKMVLKEALIEENLSLLRLAEEHMDVRAMFILEERIQELNESIAMV